MSKIFFDVKNKNKKEKSTLMYEKQIQNIVENNMLEIFGINFICSEFSFINHDSIYNGRIDSLGVDEKGRPVIFEYKLGSSDKVITQVLYYMNWLKRNKAEFQLLVNKKLPKDIKINFDVRAIIIVGELNKWELEALSELNSNIEMYRYETYDDNNLIFFELLNQENIFYKKTKNLSNLPNYQKELKKKDFEWTDDHIAGRLRRLNIPITKELIINSLYHYLVLGWGHVMIEEKILNAWKEKGWIFSAIRNKIGFTKSNKKSFSKEQFESYIKSEEFNDSFIKLKTLKW